MTRGFIGLLAVLLIVASLTTAAVAAPKGRGPAQGPGFGGDNAGFMAKELGLSDQQKAQIKVILTDHQSQIQDLMKSNLSAQEKETKRVELRQGMTEKISAVLTPEQREKAKQLMAGRREEWTDFLKDLNLTDDQKAKVKAILQDTHTKVQAVQADKSLTQQQKIQRVMQLRKDGREQIMSILTPDQRKTVMSHRGQMQGARGGTRGK